MESRPYNSPVLLKLDVQGFELQVLLGGTSTLNRAEVVIMETSLLPYNENAPLFAEVVAFMADREFVAFDFCGQTRRQTDDTLFQTDVVFKKDSSLRAPRRFWWGERLIRSGSCCSLPLLLQRAWTAPGRSEDHRHNLIRLQSHAASCPRTQKLVQLPTATSLSQRCR